MKYKVGDKVKIKSDLKHGGGYYLYYVNRNMVEFRGMIVEIIYASENSSGNEHYIIKGDKNKYAWSDDMIEGLVEETTEIKLEGNMDFKIKDYKVDKVKQTIVVFFEDGDVQKAKCCDGDTYDFERGLEVCIMKHICGGTEKYRKVLKVADEQIVAVNKAKAEAEKRAEIKARRKAKRAEKRKIKAERKRAERVAEMREAYLSALQEYNGDLDKVEEAVVEAAESEN